MHLVGMQEAMEETGVALGWPWGGLEVDFGCPFWGVLFGVLFRADHFGVSFLG